MTEEIRNDMMNFMEKGEVKYEAFRNECLVEKIKSISKAIHRKNLKTCSTLHSKLSKTTTLSQKAKIKEVAKSQKI